MSRSSPPVYAVNPWRHVRVLSIGREKSPLVCVDDFLTNADELVACSREVDFIEIGSSYPGVRAPAPGVYVSAVIAAVAPIVRDAFGSGPAADLELCAFSMVTTAPSKLKIAQRIPHFDGAELSRFAFIHYLCSSEFGGTSFYRHRATGFECVTPQRLPEYRKCIMEQLAAHEPEAEYPGATSPLFEQIHSVPAQYNRLVIYKGNALHSGDISARMRLVEDPLRGRLTVNGFGHLQE
jgi:hypothetical protein